MDAQETKAAVILHGIASDVEYVGRFTRDLVVCGSGTLSSVVSFCMAPYISLVVHESRRKLQNVDPAVLARLTRDAVAISTRSRHSLKLFEDTKRGIDGQLAYFCNEISAVYADRYLGNTWFPPARRFETDLGLYSYGGRLLTTTHVATFHLGIEPSKLPEDGVGPYLRALFEEYGAYFGSFGARLDALGMETFVAHLSASILDRSRDVRADKYYRQVFNGKGTPELNAVLTTFQAMLNFVDAVIVAGSDVRDLEYTVFKIRYLALYQVLQSVRMLLDDAAYSLTVKSVENARRIVDAHSAKLIMDPDTKHFRNTLMHYNLLPSMEIAKVDLSQPLFGLVPNYFPQYDVATFAEMVDRCVSDTTAAFNEWGAVER
ncbi:hypothetical protein [Streptomyces flavidovirens]|uniref:hypothetical protein n=1 Tax=Streptomyces flavidovirens TaxID=67298 RepID=UPI0036C615B5